MNTLEQPPVGDRVRINVDATVLSGNRHPYAGRCGLITDEKRGGTLEIAIAGETVQLGRDQVTFLQADELSVDLPPEPRISAVAATYAGVTPLVNNVAPIAVDQVLTESEFRTLELLALVASRTNPRKHFDPIKLQELASSIKASGVHQPILVRPLPVERLQETFGDRRKGEPLPTHEIVAGERRFRASVLAGVKTIPVLVRNLTDQQVLEIQLVENLQRDDLHPMEEAEGLQSLMDTTGINADDIAAKIGKSRSTVFARLQLLKLSSDVRQAFYKGIDAGGIDASRALEISRIPDAKLQAKALTQATLKAYNGGLAYNVKAFAEWVHNNLRLRLDTARFKITQVDLVKGCGSCRECPKRTGANPDLFSDVKSADVCTDPPCFHAKEAAHDEAQLDAAKKRGQKIIAGKQAKEVWQHEHVEMKDYVRIDRADKRTSSSKTVKTLLGKDAPESIILVSPHKGGELIEVLPKAAVTKLLKDKGHIKPAVREPSQKASKSMVARDLVEQYEETWRKRAIEKLWVALKAEQATGIFDNVVRLLAFEQASNLDAEQHAHVAELLGLGKVATRAAIEDYVRDEKRCDQAQVSLALMLMLMENDLEGWYNIDQPNPSRSIDAIAENFEGQVDIAAIKAEVKAEMKEKAEPKTPPPAKAAAPAKSAPKAASKKIGKAEAAAGIAAALSDASTESVNTFQPGHRVKLKIAVQKGKVKAGTAAVVEGKAGDRAWLLRLGPGKADTTVVDYTEIEFDPSALQPTDAWPFPPKVDLKGAAAIKLAALVSVGSIVTVTMDDSKLRKKFDKFAGCKGEVLEAVAGGQWLIQLEDRKGKVVKPTHAFDTGELEVIAP